MMVTWAVFAMLLLAASAEGSAAPAERTTFWVASTMADCRHKSPCNTLEGYQEDRSDIFSTSHTTWIFLKGHHKMLPTAIVMTGAQNITWMGEQGCTAKECQIIQPSYNDSTLNQNTSCSYIVFESCQGVRVSGLGFISPSRMREFPRRCRGLKFVGVEDVVLHSVTLSGRYGLGIFDASGWYEVVHSFLEFNVHFIALNFCPVERKNCSFSLHLTNVNASNSHGIYLNVGEFASREYSSISVLVDNSTFTAGFGQKILVFNIWGYPSDSFAVTVRNSVIQNNVFSVVLRMVLMVQNWSLVGGPRYRPRIHLDGVSVINSYHGVHIDLSYKFHDNNSCDVQLPEIIISNSSFFDSRNLNEDEDVHMFHATLRPNNSVDYYERCRGLHSLPISYSSPILRFQGAKFYSNEIPAVIYLEGFYWHKATFEGRNKILNNRGLGLVLNDTQLEIHGCNDIRNNTGGVWMTSDSLLLVANGSALNVMRNVADFGGGIHVSYKGRNTTSFEEFLNCYVYKTTCPGWCFFQFVDQNGRLLMPDDLSTFQANLNVWSNSALIDGNEIYNGHLDNCSLVTKDGMEPVSMHILQVLLPPSALKDNALDSVPYDLCLCDSDNALDASLWDCHRNLTRTMYPGKEYPLLVTILKDFRQFSIQTVVVTDGDSKSEVLTPEMCYKVHTVEYIEPSQHTLQLQTRAPGQGSDYVLTKSVVFNQLACPSGTHTTNTTCTCNHILSVYSFSCSAHWFKSARRYNWIGMDGGRLIFGVRCIFDLCNASVLANGIPATNVTHLSQCSSEFGREGIMCTQCPSNQQPEYFSFKCRECPYEWIALLLILFFGGVFVVVALFVFNLTILQGTINGLILYFNLIIHTWSAAFFSRYAWKPLYTVIRVLSLGFGHGLCFFDEFSKSLLHFAFPFYLLALVVTIIICAHKCNLRIFRVTFIARRAVPVLTTLMIMTFMTLSDAVLLALQYNYIYDVVTEERKVVFLFDSSLPYFRDKHLVLGLISVICSVVYLFPLIGVTLLGDLLRRCVRSIWFSHFIDVFHGSYRYPFGFWLGVRLLARVVVMVVTLSVETQFGKALSMFVVILCLCLFQLYFKPFRTLEDHIATSQYSPSSCRVFSGRSKLEAILIKLQPSTLDFLYMVNALIASAAIVYACVTDCAVNVTLLEIAANASLIAAMVQFVAILCYHTYRFFPLPKPVRMCLKNCCKCLARGRRRKKQTSTACDVTPTFDDTAAYAEPLMYISLEPLASGSQDDSHDSDENTSTSSLSDNEDRMATEQSVAVTDVTETSPGLTERLLQK